MNALFEAAREVCAFLFEKGWDYCLIGGLAVQKWGEPRTTLDADIVLYTGLGQEEVFVDAILDRFQARFPNAREFALTNRALLIRAPNGIEVDIVLGALPFEAEMIRRAGPVEFAPGLELRCCTAEDLFVLKAFAGRPRDWIDAESVAIRQTELDTEYILRNLAELCEAKGTPESLEKARRMLEESR
jgi:hypothetical protein